MLSFLKRDPTAKLEKEYKAKLEQAMHAQRSGDIKTYSMLTAEAEKIRASMDELKANKA